MPFGNILIPIYGGYKKKLSVILFFFCQPCPKVDSIPFFLNDNEDNTIMKNHLKPLSQRSLDVVFFGFETDRRKQIIKKLGVMREEMSWNMILEEV